MVQIIELQNGVAISTNKFLWDGQALAEQRDSTGATVTKRFFGQGEQIFGVSYFFTRDHLGSIREMTDNTGAIRFRGDYDPYGRQTQLQGDLNSDFGYAGMYYHAASGLNLTYFRAYDANLGRWLSKDPLAEQVGMNLYAYVHNNPIRYSDKLGLCDNDTTDDNSDLDNELWDTPTGGLFSDDSDTGTNDNYVDPPFYVDPRLLSPWNMDYDNTFLGSFSLFNLFNGNATEFLTHEAGTQAAELAAEKAGADIEPFALAAEVALLGLSTAVDMMGLMIKHAVNQIPRSSTNPIDGGGTYVGDGIIVSPDPGQFLFGQ
jgi:RHS repeat-associated protein